MAKQGQNTTQNSGIFLQGCNTNVSWGGSTGHLVNSPFFPGLSSYLIYISFWTSLSLLSLSLYFHLSLSISPWLCVSLSSFSLSISLYIYIYAGELVLVPLFGLSRVSFGTTSRVRNSTTSWGTHFRTTKIGFFEDFCDKFWCQLVFLCFCVLGPISELSLVIQHLAKKNVFFWATRSKNLGFFLTLFFKKHYKNRVFLERVAFPIASKNLFY